MISLAAIHVYTICVKGMQLACLDVLMKHMALLANGRVRKRATTTHVTGLRVTARSATRLWKSSLSYAGQLVRLYRQGL